MSSKGPGQPSIIMLFHYIDAKRRSVFFSFFSLASLASDQISNAACHRSSKDLLTATESHGRQTKSTGIESDRARSTAPVYLRDWTAEELLQASQNL